MSGVTRIAAERDRQVNAEGYTFEGDRDRSKELMKAAECYIAAAVYGREGWHEEDGTIVPPGGWPWKQKHWKPTEDAIGNLVKAGALIAAAIDSIELPDLPWVYRITVPANKSFDFLKAVSALDLHDEDTLKVIQKGSGS